MIWGVLPAALLIVTLILGFLFLRNLQARRAKEVMSKFQGKQVYAMSSGANFIGQQSKGRGRLRGNGVFVLGDKGIYFEMWVPRRTVSIPYKNVVSVETPTSFMGRFTGIKMLKVVFRNENNETDAVGWSISHVDRYVNLLNDLCRTNRR